MRGHCQASSESAYYGEINGSQLRPTHPIWRTESCEGVSRACKPDPVWCNRSSHFDEVYGARPSRRAVLHGNAIRRRDGQQRVGRIRRCSLSDHHSGLSPCVRVLLRGNPSGEYHGAAHELGEIIETVRAAPDIGSSAIHLECTRSETRASRASWFANIRIRPTRR